MPEPVRTRPRGAHRRRRTRWTLISWQHHLIGLLAGLFTLLAFRGTQLSDDWGSLWIGGLIVRSGDLSQLYSVDPEDFGLTTGEMWANIIAQIDASTWTHPYVHAPFVAQLVMPLTYLMSYQTSASVLLVLSGWAIMVLIVSSWYAWTTERIPTVYLLIGLVITWATIAFYSAAFLGQTSPLIFGAVAYALAVAREFPIRAGMVLGLVAAIKLTPVIIVAVLLLMPRYRTAGFLAGATGLALVLFSVATLGFTPMQEWITTMRMIGSSIQVAPINASFASIMGSRHIGEDVALVPLLSDPPVYLSIVPRAVAVILTLGVAATAWLRRPAGPLLPVGIFLIATATSSILWIHYALILALPLAGIMAKGRQAFRIAAMLLLLFLIPPLGDPSQLMWFPWGIMISLLGTLLLLCATVLFPASAEEPTRPDTAPSRATF